MIHRVITVQVPESRRVVVELPPEVAVGSAQLEVRVIGTNDSAVEVPPPKVEVAGLPTYIDKRSGERQLVGRSGVVREVRSAE